MTVLKGIEATRDLLKEMEGAIGEGVNGAWTRIKGWIRHRVTTV